MTAALLPVLALVALGLALRQRGFLVEEAWSGIERLTYHVLFPALIVHSLGNRDLAGVPWRPLLVAVVGTLGASTAVLIAWWKSTRLDDGPTFTSILQGGVRFNTYVALSTAEGLYGADGLAAAAVVAGMFIVVVNLICVSAFAAWGANGGGGLRGALRLIAGNPLLVACALGWTASLTRFGVPWWIDDVLAVAGRAALPLGLLAVGAALRPRALRGHTRAIVVASLVQYGVKPAVCLALVTTAGIDGLPRAALLISAMVPTAPSGYVLARQLGGDTATIASIVTAQTALAFVTMPIIAALVL